MDCFIFKVNVHNHLVLVSDGKTSRELRASIVANAVFTNFFGWKQ